MTEKKHKLSAFSVLLIMGALMIVGLGVIPTLNVQYAPARRPSTITVRFSWPNASPKLIEQEVTSKIEGTLATIEGIKRITSTSRKGSGYVSITFKDKSKMDMIRFEVASRIRYIYSELPDGVTYPTLSLATSGNQEKEILFYTINANLPPEKIEEYISRNILPQLSRIDGVSSVNLSGTTPFEYEIIFDPELARTYGISGDEIANAFLKNFDETLIGSIAETPGSQNRINVRVSGPKKTDFGLIPIKNCDGRIIYLRDIAKIIYHETEPSSYYRINGLNTINITIFAEPGSNMILVTKHVKEKMTLLESYFPENFSALLSYDASEYIHQELRKIFIRTTMSLVILLLFVLLASRNFNYLFIIFITLMANLLVAVIFYKIFDLQIHIYSLAGLTVSLGMIIDTSIMMTDHYSYYHNKKVFISILGALLTTIASLIIIFFLPENDQEKLGDFALIVIINLTISLFISFLFIPSLLEKFPLRTSMTTLRYRTKRRIIRYNRGYSKFIEWGRCHKWVFILLLILSFGLPIHLLPSSIRYKKNEEPTKWGEFYNKTIGSPFYQNRKEFFEKLLGGSFRLFSQAIELKGFYRETERLTLTINAGLPEGCTIHQLNDIVRFMENYLSQFEQIEMFQTRISSYNDAEITVTFKPEYEYTAFPVTLRNNVVSTAMNYGGATWGVYGVIEQGFSNNVLSRYKNNRIILTGYNFDRLYSYGQLLIDSLSKNRRVEEPELCSGEVRWSIPQNEYSMDYNKEKVALSDLNVSHLYNELKLRLFNSELEKIFIDNRNENVSISSAQRNDFDLWHINNDIISIDSTQIKISDFCNISKHRTGINIYKTNQTYELIAAFDFAGSPELAKRVIENNVEWLNDEILPIGYKAEMPEYSWSPKDAQKQIWLLMLVILIIYFLCSILFESLRKPLIIISMIPISFIGLFLVFGLGNFNFDQGGFAAFVLLSGLVVNAGIYIINEYNHIRTNWRRDPLQAYIKAYNRKITPIMLTIISTILGLLPFLYDGKDEVFWFAFAIGAMGGMLFSIIALVVYLPILLPLRKR